MGLDDVPVPALDPAPALALADAVTDADAMTEAEASEEDLADARGEEVSADVLSRLAVSDGVSVEDGTVSVFVPVPEVEAGDVDVAVTVSVDVLTVELGVGMDARVSVTVGVMVGGEETVSVELGLGLASDGRMQEIGVGEPLAGKEIVTGVRLIWFAVVVDGEILGLLVGVIVDPVCS